MTSEVTSKSTCCDYLKEYLPDVAFCTIVVAGGVFTGYGYLGEMVKASAAAFKASGFTMMGTGSFAEFAWRWNGAERRGLRSEVNALKSQVHGISEEKEAFHKENQELRIDIDQFSSNLKTMEKGIDLLHQEQSSFEEHHKVLLTAFGNKVEGLDHTKDGLEDKVVKLAKQIGAAKNLIQQMLNRDATLGKLVDSVRDEQAKVSKLLSQVTEIEERNISLLKKMERSEAHIEELEKRLAEKVLQI